jgi:hypothetical protein
MSRIRTNSQALQATLKIDVILPAKYGSASLIQVALLSSRSMFTLKRPRFSNSLPP